MPIQSSIKIGRSSTNDIVISDINVSRNHAVITDLGSGNYEIVDLNSTNGTYVNGVRITRKTIRQGDKVEAAGCFVNWLATFSNTRAEQQTEGVKMTYSDLSHESVNILKQKTKIFFTDRKWLWIALPALAIIIISIYISLISNNNLNRKKAEELIVNKYRLPQVESTIIEKIYIKSYGAPYSGRGLPMVCIVTGPQYSDSKEMLSQLEQKGVIKVSENGPIGGCYIVQAVVNLTDEGRKYLISENNDQYKLKTAEIAFGEITGIQIHKEFNVAEATYTLIRKNITPFGNNVSQEPIKRRASFALFDDGWRIEK